MLDIAQLVEEKISFYRRPEFIDNPFHPAGFRGTWTFSDHSLIPDIFHGFLQRYFGVLRLRRIPIEKINELMNEIWEGPGSLEKVFRMELEMQLSGKLVKILPSDVGTKTVKTVKDDDEDDLDSIPDLPLSAFGNEMFEDNSDEDY